MFNAWLEDEFEYSPVRNMEELVKFHEDHKDICLPPGKRGITSSILLPMC